jgi:hypothetical protein
MFQNTERVSILRAPPRNRRFLVYVRCGSNARATLFNNSSGGDRNYDVALNFYSAPHPEDAVYEWSEFLIGGGLSKFHAAKQFLYTGILDRYLGVLFLDDDLDLHFDLGSFFEYCEAAKFAMAQPSLTHSSDGAWRITYHHPGFEYRLTNFVEVMGPYFARDFLMTVVESFDLSISTYGLDVFWGMQLEEGQQAAIVDRFQMSHLKRRNLASGDYYGYLQSIGVDWMREMKNILELLKLDSYEIRMRGGMEIIERVQVG